MRKDRLTLDLPVGALWREPDGAAVVAYLAPVVRVAQAEQVATIVIAVTRRGGSDTTADIPRRVVVVIAALGRIALPAARDLGHRGRAALPAQALLDACKLGRLADGILDAQHCRFL